MESTYELTERAPRESEQRGGFVAVPRAVFARACLRGFHESERTVC